MRKELILLMILVLIPLSSGGIIDNIYDFGINVFTSKVANNKYDVRITSEELIKFDGCSGYIPFDLTNLVDSEKEINLGMMFENDLCEVKWYEGYEWEEKVDYTCDLVPTGKIIEDKNGSYEEYVKNCYTIDRGSYVWKKINLEDQAKYKSRKTKLSKDKLQSYTAYVECKCGSSGKFDIYSYSTKGRTELDPYWESSLGNWPIETFTNTEVSGDTLNLSSGQTSGSAISVGFGTGIKRINWIDAVLKYITQFGTAESGNKSYEFYEGEDSDQELTDGAVRGNQFTIGTVGPNETFTITMIELKLFKAGNPGNLSITIANVDDAGKPTTILTTVKYPPAGAPTSNTLVNISLPPVELSNTPANINYSWYVEAFDSSGSDHWHIRRDESSPSYAGGEGLVSSNSGASWTVVDSLDFLFRIYGFTTTDLDSDVNMTVCYSDDNSSWSSCQIGVNDGNSLDNETAFYGLYMLNLSRDDTSLAIGVQNVSINFSLINNAPTKPTNQEPLNFTIFTVNTNIGFNWTNSTDLDQDTITYNFEIYNDSALTNLHSSITGITETATPTSTTISNFATDGDYFYRINAFDGFDNSSWTEVTTLVIDTDPPAVEIVNPMNTSFPSNNVSLDVNCDDKGSNCTNHQYSLNGAANVSFIPNTTFIGIEGNNNIIYCAEDNFARLNCTDAVNFVVDTIVPGFDFINPRNQTENLRTLDINISATEEIDTYLYSINNAANVTFNGNVSVFFSDGDQNLFVCVNDTTNNLFCNNTLFFVNGTAILNPVTAIESLIYETDTGFYEANITFNPLLVNTVNVTFNYNNTNVTTNKENISDGFVNFKSNIPIPPIGANTTKSFNPLIDLFFINGSAITNITTNQTQEVALINFSICAGDNNARFINVTFQDESTGLQHNGSIISSTFQHSLSPDLAEFKTLKYSQIIDQISHEFCFEPQQFKLFSDIEIAYTAEGFEQRTFNNVTSSFTNETNNVTLFLLSSTEGLFVTFQVVNIATQPIEGVRVTVVREGIVIEEKNTDAAGGATFFLDPDTSYTLTFVKAGFDTLTTTITPSQSQFTIVLGEISVVTQSPSEGISFSIEPDLAALQNETDYNFNFTVDSSFLQIQLAGFSLRNSTSSIQLGSASCSGDTGCIALTTINTGNNSDIVMEWFWQANNTFVNGTKTWSVSNQFVGLGSFKAFFTDFEKLGSGMDNFAKGLISIFIIVFMVGLITVKVGNVSRSTVLVTIWAITGFLDAGNFLPQIPGTPPFFITVVMGLLVFGFIWLDFTR